MLEQIQDVERELEEGLRSVETEVDRPMDPEEMTRLDENDLMVR